MAQGDVIWFDQALVDGWEKIHDLENDVIKVGHITSAATPAATTADPRWGAGGSTNFSTNEVTPGGNYPAGGPTAANNAVTLDTGAAKFDADDLSVLQNGSNPTNARWGIIYNDTATGKNCLGYLDLGSDIDLSAGDYSVAWNVGGIATIDQA